MLPQDSYYLQNPFITALSKEKICESSPIELQISPYGQWTMTHPRDRNELQPPLYADNPLMIPIEQLLMRGGTSTSSSSARNRPATQTNQSRHHQPAIAAVEAGEAWTNPSSSISGGGAGSPIGTEDSEKWLSQVEIVTHVGPHRRLWMGPQFCFKTFRPAKSGSKTRYVGK